MSQIYRLHYRAQLQSNYTIADIQAAIDACIQNIRSLQKQQLLLTAALYHADHMLFLYYEAIGEPCEVIEPIAINRQEVNATIAESGEDIQATVPKPTEFLAPLAPYLMAWPGQCGERLWVHMYHIYYHNRPESVAQWKRAMVPEKRRGRIAFLREDKLFSYVYYHKAIVDEGLFAGDKYQSIALHENILFSYFEEPKTMVNIQNNGEESSQALEAWVAQNPESHFIHMPEGKGENFMFLPALFALGVEDMLD